MATIKIILYKSKKLKNGTNPVMLRIHKDERRYFSLGHSCKPEQWDEQAGRFKADKRINADHLRLNKELENDELRARKIIRDFEHENVNFTLAQFESRFIGQPKKQTVEAYFISHIEALNKKERFGYANTFQSTLDVLNSFDPNFIKKKFSDIDYNYIVRFSDHLKRKCVKDTSISVYMRTLRTLLISAIDNGEGSRETFPFSNKYGDGKYYRISELNHGTKKRFLHVDHLKKFKEASFIEPYYELARRLFLTSFYLRGMSWVDMAYLTKENLSNEIMGNGEIVKTIEYARKKTHKQQTGIIITLELEEMLSFFKANYNLGDFLLPIITKPELKGNELRKHITHRRKRYQLNLRTVAKLLDLPIEISEKLTTYYSRHSFAMALQKKGISKEKISEALGHSDLNTTTIYLDSFGVEAMADISKDLI